MSRLGKKPIIIPDNVNVSVSDNLIEISGPKGKLSQKIFDNISVAMENRQLLIKNLMPSGERKMRKLFKKTDSLQGLLRTLIINKINGSLNVFEKILEIHGVGYKTEVKDKKLILNVGFNHPVEIDIPETISIEVVHNTILFIRGFDKELLGNLTAKIRSICPPEPYKGKGIRYRGEYVRHKVGKAAIAAQK
ncbi:MAG: 50S ribosomal protein L6 [Candidatus Omnitrophica bacterium]|nr:50S ribosomal protein L6 [Candidatus Omnitrophota bacterium]